MKNFTLKAAAVVCGMLMCSASAEAQTNLVISKVFYSGTSQKGSTKNYAGGEEYIVIHNNSDKEQDIAGLYVGLIESESTAGYYAADATGNEIKLKQVFQIPTDRVYNIAPWGDVTIAACAMDHSGAAENGPDLSKADFTFGNMTGDVESATPLNLVFSFNANTKAVNLTNGGDAGVVIITKKNGDSKLTYGDESTWVFANGKTSGSRYLPFNAYYALDCVEILKTKAVDGVYTIDDTRKRIKDSYDAGYVPADQKMLRDGFVAYRKTALNNDGKVLLYDTNNSSVDFMISNTIALNEYNAVEDGTTAVKVTVPESGYLPFNAEKFFFTGKDLYIAYVSISSGNVTFSSKEGKSVVANNSAYILVGAPGEHTIYYTESQRNLASAGADAWIADGDEKYVDGVLTITTKNRFPMKLVNEKGNVRFVHDCVEGNNQTLKIDVETEGRFYINHTVFTEGDLVWEGVTPEDVPSTAIKGVKEIEVANSACFNLAGQRVGSNAKGIVIMNGKKFLKN